MKTRTCRLNPFRTSFDCFTNFILSFIRFSILHLVFYHTCTIDHLILHLFAHLINRAEKQGKTNIVVLHPISNFIVVSNYVRISVSPSFNCSYFTCTRINLTISFFTSIRTFSLCFLFIPPPRTFILHHIHASSMRSVCRVIRHYLTSISSVFHEYRATC